MARVHPAAASETSVVRLLASRAGRLAIRSSTTGERTLIGVAGAPGVGKSTVAAAVVAVLLESGRRAVLVPMDGFHLAGSELERLGRTDRKGAPDTFDAAGYVALLRRLRERDGRTVYAPQFRREIEEPVAGALAVTPDVDVVVTEGNYLLLDEPPWCEVRGLLDETWFLTLGPLLRRERLARRHQRYGRSPAAAWQHTLGSDEVNALLVEETRDLADLVIDLAADPVGAE
jgi:pantothenate kinase